MVFWGISLLLLLLLLPLPPLSSSSPSTDRCPTSCGSVAVPYPFGLRLACAKSADFNLTCDETSAPPKLSVFGLEVSEILVGQGQILASTGQDLINGGAWLSNGHYSVSKETAVLDWVVDHMTCNDAAKNASRYACVSSQSTCRDNNNATFGYRCECSPGFQGNPYLAGGCQDIDECRNGTICYGICTNYIGTYNCTCPSGTHGDPTREACLPIKRSYLIFGIIIGVGAGLGTLFLSACIFFFHRRLKKIKLENLKQKYFHKNKGLLLQQLISSSDDDVAEKTKIFSLEDLEKATADFHESRILGRGGHGTVYKGILSDQRVVAVKKSKIVVEREIAQFINEVAVLSQIKHRNVVKLFGSCLETQVPLLVYEFVTNGTLSDHLHDRRSSLPWRDRLRIASEVAGALAHLHSSASISVFHRDVKSSNVLLDDNFVAKVSDFGASRSIPFDESRVTTMVQGTFGYLDPEYFHTGRLTEKSDVYSFGMILVELLTGEKAVSFDKCGEERSLAAKFIGALHENRILELIDARIRGEGTVKAEEIEVVAELAESCLRMRGEERPTMKEVEVRLEALRRNYMKKQEHPWARKVAEHDERKSLFDGSQYSLEKEFLLSLEYSR